MLLSSLKISSRIALLAGINLLLILTLGGVATYQMNKIGIELIEVAEEDLPITNMLSKVAQHQLEQAILFERSLSYATAIKYGDDRSQEMLKTTKAFHALADKVDQEFKQLEELLEHAITKAHSTEAKEQFASLLTTILNIDKNHAEYDELALSLFQKVKDGYAASAIASADHIIELEDKIDHELIDALDQIQAFTLEATQRAEHDELKAQKLIMIIFVASLILGVSLALLISRTITSPVSHMRDRLKEISDGDGDLTVRLPVTGQDETAEAAAAFNRLMEKLGKMVTTIRSTSTQLVQRSEQSIVLMDATRDQVEQQKRETEQTATAAEQMSGSITEIAQSTDHAAELGRDVLEKVQSGSGIAKQNQQAIEQLNINVESAATQLTSLATETNRISEVLDDIRGIAEQTNLLALNAAIEAARAGESGRGFAVVADEVRSLSQRTQSSTEDIQELLENLQSATNGAISVMQKGQENAGHCIQQANHTAAELEEASAAVEGMSAMNTQIAAAAEEQSAVVKEIHASLSSITLYASSTNDSANQTSDINKEVSNELLQLNTLVSELRA